MEKVKGIKNLPTFDERTKQKLGGLKQKANQKATMNGKNKKQNDLALRLISQSALVSQQSNISHSEESDTVQQVDPLCIYGIIQNISQFDDQTKKKFACSGGLAFDIGQYRVFFVGRHQVNFKNGLPVSLYIPQNYQLHRNEQTKKLEIVIERKIKKDVIDPMKYPYVMVDPSNSLYPTYICSWIQCKRKITLEHYIEYEEETNEFFVFGNAIHRYLQWLIRKEVQPQKPTQTQFRKLYESYLYQMYLINAQFDTFLQKVTNGISNLVKWYKMHIVKGQKIQLNKWQKKYLKITKVIGSQVVVKSKYLGIRGKVDGLLEGQFIDQKLKISYAVVVPFQLKTGLKILDSHKKQVQFYNLLLRENRNMPVIGLLYYSDSNIFDYRLENPLICFENINCHRNRILINVLNLYQESGQIRLPGLPDTFDQCKLCDVSLQCYINRKQSNQIADLQDVCEQVPEKYSEQLRERLKKLTVLQVQFLKKWTRLLHLEQCAQKKMNEQNRKKNYFDGIKISLSEMQKFRDYEQTKNLRLIIFKQIQSQTMSEQLDNYFRVGEKMRIFMPLIRLADSCRVVSTWKNTKRFSLQIQIRNQNIKFNKNKCIFLLQSEQIQSIQVQLQKYQNSFYNYARGYCYKFVTMAQPWLKDIVINQNYQPTNNKKILEIDFKQTQDLNQDQKQAFKKCMQMERFCLVQGMPGTGKTQLILKLIQYYYRIGARVLVTSFTNQALINILDRQINEQKVIPQEFIVREGSRYNVNSEFDYLGSQSQSQSHKSIDDYKSFFNKKKVWFTTISSLYIHHIPKKFDVVIVDEASQCLQAICLQALIKADKFVLIGDEKQLQPVVKSKQAINEGMQISLFERLCSKYSQMKTVLKKQYRMSPAIMNLTNNLVYQGRLQLGKSSMKQRVLSLVLDWKQRAPQFLHSIIDPGRSLRFVNYDNALNLFNGDDSIDIKRIQRLLQIRITCCLYKYFRLLGIKKQQILIISAFNSIVHQLVAALKKQNLIEQNNSDVLTIDKSQGTDKEVIIFIFHQGNRQLIQNYRRLNVALTRAKNKFIIVGSQKQLSSLATWTGRLAKLLIPDQINIERQFLQKIVQDKQIESQTQMASQVQTQKYIEISE